MFLKLFYLYRNHQDNISLLLHFIPVLGVWLFGWNIFIILFLFQIDMLVIGVFYAYGLSRVYRKQGISILTLPEQERPRNFLGGYFSVGLASFVFLGLLEEPVLPSVYSYIFALLLLSFHWLAKLRTVTQEKWRERSSLTKAMERAQIHFYLMLLILPCYGIFLGILPTHFGFLCVVLVTVIRFLGDILLQEAPARNVRTGLTKFYSKRDK